MLLVGAGKHEVPWATHYANLPFSILYKFGLVTRVFNTEYTRVLISVTKKREYCYYYHNTIITTLYQC